MSKRRSPWLLASIVWAAMHVPRFAHESGGTGLLGAADIVPLGLLWGYMTHRTGSILPAVLVHATNLWNLA